MSEEFKSNDGLMFSDDFESVLLWNEFDSKSATQREVWTKTLRDMGVKLAHPDDGWVREAGRGEISPEYDDGKCLTVSSYAQFNDHPQVGDIIALGWPYKNNGRNYRLVTVTKVEFGGTLIPTEKYYYNDNGAVLPTKTKIEKTRTTKSRFFGIFNRK